MLRAVALIGLLVCAASALRVDELLDYNACISDPSTCTSISSFGFGPLTGSLPTELGTFTNLADLDLFDNIIAGTIPSELALLASLTRLVLFNNQLTGSIPEALGELQALSLFLFDQNSLCGTFFRETSDTTTIFPACPSDPGDEDRGDPRNGPRNGPGNGPRNGLGRG